MCRFSFPNYPLITNFLGGYLYLFTTHSYSLRTYILADDIRSIPSQVAIPLETLAEEVPRPVDAFLTAAPIVAIALVKVSALQAILL